MRRTLLMIFAATAALFAIQNHPTSLVIERIQSEWDGSYPIRFVFLGDSRNPFDPGEPSGDSVFAIIRQKVNELAPLFAIHGGDFVQDGYREEYPACVWKLDSFEVNLLTVRGNHEIYGDFGPFLYDSVWGPTDYYFDLGIYRFIVFADCQQDSDTVWYGHKIDYLVSEEQLDWLDSLLADADRLGMYSLVFAHVPPYNPGHDTTHCLGYSGYLPEPNYELSHTEELSEILASHRVLMGGWSHQHFYDRSEYMGVPYIITGGAGAPLDSAISPPPYGADFYHFLLFELDSAGNLTGYLYRAGFDSPEPGYTFTISPSKIAERPISPKPQISAFNGILFVRGNVPKGECTLRVAGIDGRKISEAKIKLSRGRNVLPARLFPADGVYFLEISGDDFTWRGKTLWMRK